MSLSIADSKAVLQRRVKEVGLGDKLETIKKLGFETHSDLGFAFNFTPGGSEEAFQVTLVEPILGAKTDTNTQAKKPALRKLHFESYTIAMQDVQNRTVKTYIPRALYLMTNQAVQKSNSRNCIAIAPIREV